MPQYFKTNEECLTKGIKKIKVPQYPGYITNLKNYDDYDNYIATNFSKKSKYKFLSYKRTLDNAFYINYKHICGGISKDGYNTIFNEFFTMWIPIYNDNGIKVV